MDLESAVYGLIGGAIIVLLALAAGFRVRPQDTTQRFAFFLVAFFFFAILQVAGVGASFAVAAGICAALLLVYMGVRRVIVRQPR